ncbi:hypothetical protein [Nocardioides pacificus]
MKVKDRAAALTRAKQALSYLESHPATSCDQLGVAREHLNRIHRHAERAYLIDVVEGIEQIVLDVYGHHPEHHPT